MAEQTLFHARILSNPDAVPMSRYAKFWKLCGVYAIANTVTGKFYIGSSANMGLRLRNHRAQLRRGDHKNTKLLRSFRKHGEDAFVICCVEVCGETDRVVREQAWMEGTSVALQDKGYNIARTADCSIPSPETRRRQRLSHLGHRHTEEAKRKIGAASRGNKYSLGYRHTVEAKRKIREFLTGSNNPRLGKPGYHAGKKLPPEIAETRRKCIAKGRLVSHERRKRKVEQIDLASGEVVAVFPSMKEAAAATGFHKQSISAICRGAGYRRSTGLRFTWKYAECHPTSLSSGPVEAGPLFSQSTFRCGTANKSGS